MSAPKPRCSGAAQNPAVSRLISMKYSLAVAAVSKLCGCVFAGDPQAFLPEENGDHVSVWGVDRWHPAVQQRQEGRPHHVPSRRCTQGNGLIEGRMCTLFNFTAKLTQFSVSLLELYRVMYRMCSHLLNSKPFPDKVLSILVASLKLCEPPFLNII